MLQLWEWASRGQSDNAGESKTWHVIIARDRVRRWAEWQGEADHVHEIQSNHRVSGVMQFGLHRIL